ncbi:hypothetical protein ABPG74_006837 [Tetrahymena malaccensis]
MEIDCQEIILENQNQFENDDDNMFLVPFQYNSPFGSQNNTDQKNSSEENLDSDEQESKEETIDLATLKAMKEMKRKKRIQKKIKKENGLVNKMTFVIQNSVARELFKLNCGVFVTLDGVLRYCYCLTPISFGFYPTRIVKIEERHNLGIIDINHQIDRLVPKKSVEDCVDLMMNRNIANLNKQELCNQLEVFDQLTKSIYYSAKTPEQMRSIKEQEFKDFIQCAFDYIEQTQNNENNKFFIFNIGRYNFIDQEVELAHTGLSKSYLSLLGLDCASFKTVILRNQKIDLIQDKADVIFQALKGIGLKMKYNQSDNYTANINTFDGFPLQVNYQVRNVTLSQKLNNKFGREYILSIIHATLSPQQMQGLVDYRQKLMQNYNKFSIDEYIRKELSYFFEDVEYSIQSQQFLEKYYKENLKSLLSLEQRAQFYDDEEKNSKECGFRGVFI